MVPYRQPGQQAPPGEVWTSSANNAARASPGFHQPRQAQGQILPGLQPEGANVSATNGKAAIIHVNSGSPCLPLP
ncbi:unnamed protein product [Prunus armeniaca]